MAAGGAVRAAPPAGAGSVAPARIIPWEVQTMAAASLDQARIVAFALEHGTSAAARRFRVSDSYVRRLKRSAAPAAAVAAPARPGLRLVHAPSVPVSKVTQIQYAPAPQLVATADKEYFKCPRCDELVKVPAGSRLVEWLAEQNAVHSHASMPPTPAVMSAPAVSPSLEVVLVLSGGSEASQCFSSAVPVPVLGSAPSPSSAGVVPVATVPHASSPRFAAVMAFVLPWLVEYWRFVLGLVLGVCLLVYLSN